MSSAINIGNIEATLSLKGLYTPVVEKFEADLRDAAKAPKIIEDSTSRAAKAIAKETEKIERDYRRLAASLDPAVKNNQKYEQSQKTLDAAVKRGIISQSQYASQLDKVKNQLQSNVHWTSRLGSSIGSELVGNFTRFFAVTALVTGGIRLITSVTQQYLTANIEAEESSKRVEEAVRRYGATSGVTVSQIDELAQAQSRLTGIDDELIADAEVIGLKFNRIGTDIFPRFTRAAVDMSVATGTDLTSAFEKAGRIVNQPLKGLTLLTREGYAVSKSQSDMVKALVRSGDIMGAQGVMLNILEGQYGGAAAAARDTMGGAVKALQTTWENFLERVGENNMGPLRQGLEAVISLLEIATDNVKYLDIGFLYLQATVTGFAATAYRALASVAEAVRDIGSKVFPALKSDRSAEGYNAAADKLFEISAKSGMALARALTGVSEGHKKGATGALEQTDAERKLGKEINKVADAIRLSIDEMQRKAQNAKTAYLAATIGIKEYNKEVLRQKVVAAILSEENKLRDTDKKLTEAQRNAIAQAVIMEDEFNKKLKETLELNKKLIDVALTATDNIAGSGFARDFQKELNKVHEGILLINRDVEEMLSALDLSKELEADAGMAERFLSVSQVDSHLQRVEENYLEFLRRMGEGFEQGSENAIEAGERILAKVGSRFGDTVDEIKAHLAKLDDIQIAADFKESLKPNQSLKDLRETLSRLQATTDKTGKSLLSAAEAQKVYTRALGETIEETLDAASNLLTQIGQITKSKSLTGAGNILGAAGGAVGASNTYSQDPSMMAAMGAVGAWLSLFVTIAETFTKRGGLHYGADIKSGGLGNLEVTDSFTYVKGGLHEAQKAAKEIADTIENIVSSFGGQLQSIRTFGIMQTGEGWAVSFGGDMRRYFEEFSDAVAWAAHKAISEAEVSGISDEILKAFKNYTFRTLEDLQAFSTYAREYTSYGASELTGNLRSLTDWFIESARKAYEYGLSISKVSDEFGRRAQSWRDQVLGITRSPQEQLKQNVVDFNRWIEQQKLSAQIQIDAARGQMQAAQAQMNAAMLQLKGLGKDADPEIQQLFLESQRLFKDAAARLDLWTKALENLPPAITPEEEEKAKGRVGKGGGGGGDRENVRDFIRNKQFELASRLMTDYARAQAEIIRQYEEQIKQTGRDAKARAELIALREKELALLAQEKARNTVASFREFMGFVNQFSEVRDTAQKLIEDISESPFGDVREANMIGRVLDELNDKLNRVSLEGAVSALSAMLQDMEAFGATEAQMSEARKHIALIEHTLRMDQYAKQIAILKAEGKLSEAVMKTIEGSFAFLSGVDPLTDIEKVDAQVDKESKRAEAWYAAQANQADAMKETTNEVERLREAFRDAKDRILETVRDFDLGEHGIVAPEASLETAEKRFADVINRANRGDLKAFEESSEAFDDLIETMKRYSPALAAAQGGLRRDELESLAHLSTIVEGNLVITDFEIRQQHKETVDTLNNGFADLSEHASGQEERLSDILEEMRRNNEIQADLNSRLERIESGKVASG